MPHEPIFNLLKKFDGETVKDYSDSKKKFFITKLPKYLIIVLKRFSKNNFFTEKNPTIVSFPLNNLDMTPCKTKNYYFDLIFFFFKIHAIKAHHANIIYWLIFVMKEKLQRKVYIKYRLGIKLLMNGKIYIIYLI